MSQLIAKNAKPKRCNAAALRMSLRGTILKNGEYMLVSTKNKMNTKGVGYFDGYVKGDGVTRCENLVIHKLEEDPYVTEVVRQITEEEVTKWNASADDATVVHKTGNETVGGAKTFSDAITTSGIKSDDYVAGMSGSGYDLSVDATTNKSRLTVDELMVRTPTRYYLKVDPPVINKSSDNGKTITIKAYKVINAEPPVLVETADNFVIFVESWKESGSSSLPIISARITHASNNGILSLTYNNTRKYSDIILYKGDPRLFGSNPVEYDRLSFVFVDNGADGADGDDGAAGAAGTGFIIKGDVKGYYNDIQDIPSGGFSAGDKVIVDNNPIGEYALLTLDNSQWVDDTPSIGDSYKQVNSAQSATYNHLFYANGTRWVDLGQITATNGADGADGTDGVDGTDAAVFYASVNPIIIDESVDTNGNYSYMGNAGNSSANIASVKVCVRVGSSSEQNATITNLGYASEQALLDTSKITYSGNVITLQQGSIRGAGNAAVREGYIMATCSYTVGTTTYTQALQINVYVNRVGTWVHTVRGDISSMYSEALRYVDNQGFLTASSEILQYAEGITLKAMLNSIVQSLISIDIDGTINLKASKVLNIVTPVINAVTSEIIARVLRTVSDDGMEIKIERGMIQVYYLGVLRIELGLSGDNPPAPVFNFYDADGKLTRSLDYNGVKEYNSGTTPTQQHQMIPWNVWDITSDIDFVEHPIAEGSGEGALQVWLSSLILPTWDYIWTEPSGNLNNSTTIYKVWFERYGENYTAPTGSWPCRNKYSGAYIGDIDISAADVSNMGSVEAATDRLWRDTNFAILDGDMSNPYRVFVGESQSYTDTVAPFDYEEHWYYDEGEDINHRVSDWASGTKVWRELAIVKDGNIMASIKVYRRIEDDNS